MNKRIITQEPERSKKLNDALESLRNVYEPDVKKLVSLCYKLGATQEQIGDALDLTRSTVSLKYPRRKEENE